MSMQRRVLSISFKIMSRTMRNLTNYNQKLGRMAFPLYSMWRAICTKRLTRGKEEYGVRDQDFPLSY